MRNLQTGGNKLMSESFKIADVVVSPQHNSLTIYRNDDLTHIHLPPKEMNLLVLLANHQPDTLTRQTMIEVLWKNRPGAEDLVVRLIADLRKKLGDNHRSPKYIQTVPKKGYRLIPMVEPLPVEPMPIEPLPVEPQPTTTKSRAHWPILYVILTLIVISPLGYWFVFDSQLPSPVQYRKTKLIASLAQEGEPRFSRAGTRVFSENNLGAYNSENAQIAITNLANRQTSYFSYEDNVAGNRVKKMLWSPVPVDNQMLFTALDNKGQCTVNIHDFVSKLNRPFIDCSQYKLVTVDWLPSNNQVVAAFYLNEQPDTDNIGLKIINVVTGKVALSAPSDSKNSYSSNSYYHSPRASHFGADVVVIKTDIVSHQNTLVIWDIESNQLRDIYQTDSEISQVVWLDAQTLLYSSLDSANPGIYQLDISSGLQHIIYHARVLDFDYQVHTGLMVTSEGESNLEIFGQDIVTGHSQNLSNSTVTEHSPYVSQSGQWLSYLGNKQGHFNLYKKALNDSVETQLTDFIDANVLSYRWSEDEKKVLLNISQKGKFEAVLFDLSTEGLLGQTEPTRYPNVINSVFGLNDGGIYLAKSQNNQVKITNNQQTLFTLADVSTLNHFEVFNETLFYQTSVYGPVFSHNLNSQKTQLKLPSTIVHWYINKAGKLLFSFIPETPDHDTTTLPIGQLDLNATSEDFELINARAPMNMGFYHDSLNKRLYYAQKVPGDKSTLYLLTPL